MSFELLITKLIKTCILVKTLREKKQEKNNKLTIDNKKRTANKEGGGFNHSKPKKNLK